MRPDTRVEEKIGYLVKRLQQQIRAALDARLAQHGVSMSTYAALAVLEHAPGLSNAELARRCFVTAQTMNAIVRDLGDAGVVERRRDPNHGRILQTQLTRRGRDLVGVCHAEVNAVHTQMLADLTATEQTQFRDLLTRSIDALQA
ncbi:MarR family transcriptional regulator [soil metagenome]